MDISSLRERRAETPLTVSELNNYVKGIFDKDRLLSLVSVRGEISNFVRHSTGHLYFSLKDGEGQIRCVMFRSAAARLKFVPENGMKVILRGSVTVFVRDGSYQVYVNAIEPDGIGALYLAYEQMKQKLSDEGLFDEEHKLPLPIIPERIGVITSPTGAAVRDIINVTGRRFPHAKIYVYPVLVQGDGAVDTLVEALDYFESSRQADVIIIGRGGGSIEDLWAFNSEILARKIYDMTVPVISAVGHETDFTICDFVADMRAPTPSAAAEIAVPDKRELLMRIDGNTERLLKALLHMTERKREVLNKLTEREILLNPSHLFEEKKENLLNLHQNVASLISEKISDSKSLLILCSEKLNALSPLGVLARGYSVVSREGEGISDANKLCVGDEISIRMHRGDVVAKIDKIMTSEE